MNEAFRIFLLFSSFYYGIFEADAIMVVRRIVPLGLCHFPSENGEAGAFFTGGEQEYSLTLNEKEGFIWLKFYA